MKNLENIIGLLSEYTNKGNIKWTIFEEAKETDKHSYVANLMIGEKELDIVLNVHKLMYSKLNVHKLMYAKNRLKIYEYETKKVKDDDNYDGELVIDEVLNVKLCQKLITTINFINSIKRDISYHKIVDLLKSDDANHLKMQQSILGGYGLKISSANDTPGFYFDSENKSLFYTGNNDKQDSEVNQCDECGECKK